MSYYVNIFSLKFQLKQIPTRANRMEEEVVKRAVPAAFVKWTEVQKVLEECNTGGVISTSLMSHDGSLLSMAGGDSSVEKVIGAIISNIWHTYEYDGADAYGAEDLNTIFLDCEKGRVAVARVSRFLICMYGDESVDMGLLRTKLLALRSFLYEPLLKVYPVEQLDQ